MTDNPKTQFSDKQLANLFNTLSLMCSNSDRAKAMSNLELKDFIINSDVYGKLSIGSIEISILEEILERLSPSEISLIE